MIEKLRQPDVRMLRPESCQNMERIRRLVRYAAINSWLCDTDGLLNKKSRRQKLKIKYSLLFVRQCCIFWGPSREIESRWKWYTLLS